MSLFDQVIPNGYLKENSQETYYQYRELKFVITPTTPQTPFPFSKDTPTNQADFTALANFCGCPAISLPLKRSGEEKPVGLQIMAGPGSDIDLLSFALGIEKLISNN